MITKTVEVTQTILVTVDETKINDEFMREFREVFYEFDDLDDHIKHLAQCYARGIVDDGQFLEGYGLIDEMGIEFKKIDQDEEIFP